MNKDSSNKDQKKWDKKIKEILKKSEKAKQTHEQINKKNNQSLKAERPLMQSHFFSEQQERFIHEQKLVKTTSIPINSPSVKNRTDFQNLNNFDVEQIAEEIPSQEVYSEQEPNYDDQYENVVNKMMYDEQQQQEQEYIHNNTEQPEDYTNLLNLHHTEARNVKNVNEYNVDYNPIETEVKESTKLTRKELKARKKMMKQEKHQESE